MARKRARSRAIAGWIAGICATLVAAALVSFLQNPPQVKQAEGVRFFQTYFKNAVNPTWLAENYNRKTTEEYRSFGDKDLASAAAWYGGLSEIEVVRVNDVQGSPNRFDVILNFIPKSSDALASKERFDIELECQAWYARTSWFACPESDIRFNTILPSDQ